MHREDVCSFISVSEKGWQVRVTAMAVHGRLVSFNLRRMDFAKISLTPSARHDKSVLEFVCAQITSALSLSPRALRDACCYLKVTLF